MKKFPVTLILLALNSIVFAVISFRLQSVLVKSDAAVYMILQYGANFNPLSMSGESWRLITSMFLHFGIFHFATNMIGLFNIGNTLERETGSLHFLLIYFICGLASGLGSLAFNAFVISAGASGALFGIYGYALVLEIIKSLSDRGQLGRVILGFFIFIVINVAVTMQISVDIYGHIFGFIAGVALALLGPRLQWITQLWQLVMVLVLLPFLLLIMPHDQVEYYNVFQRVVAMERKTNALFDNTDTDAELKDGFISLLPEWDSIRHTIRNMKEVHPSVISDTLVLGRYSALRRQEMLYRITMMERNSYIYLDSLDFVGEQMDSLPPLGQRFMTAPDSAKISRKEKPAVAKPQTSPAKVMYDDWWKETLDPSAMKYYRIGERDSLGRWEGNLRDYYDDGHVQMRGKYSQGLKDGIFIYYSDRHTYESAGRYDKEQSVGKWEYFHWNGKLFREVMYGQETFTGNVYDSLGNRQVSLGNGKEITWYANGQVREEGEYRLGKREGYWVGYYADGRQMFEEYYADNRLIRGKSLSRDGRRFIYDQLSVFPSPIDGMKAFMDYVEANRHKPKGSPPGRVEVIFNVGTDNAIWDIQILKGLTPACDEEAVRLVREGPAWRPGVLHGITPVQGTGYVVIPF